MREAVEEAAIQARTSSFVDQSVRRVRARHHRAHWRIVSLQRGAPRAAQLAAGVARWRGRCDLFAALPGLAGKDRARLRGRAGGARLQVCRHLHREGAQGGVRSATTRIPTKSGSGGNVAVRSASSSHFQKRCHGLELSEDEGDDGSLRWPSCEAVPGLAELAKASLRPGSKKDDRVAAMELVLEGLLAPIVAPRSKRASVRGASSTAISSTRWLRRSSVLSEGPSGLPLSRPGTRSNWSGQEKALGGAAPRLPAPGARCGRRRRATRIRTGCSGSASDYGWFDHGMSVRGVPTSAAAGRARRSRRLGPRARFSSRPRGRSVSVATASRAFSRGLTRTSGVGGRGGEHRTGRRRRPGLRERLPETRPVPGRANEVADLDWQ